MEKEERNYDIVNTPEGYTVVDEKYIPLHRAELTSCNILCVEVGSNGFQGGDSGHGSRTVVRLTDIASTDLRLTFRCKPLSGGGIGRSDTGRIEGKDLECETLSIIVGGDSELDTLIGALEFAVETLKKKAYGKEQ